MIVDDPLPDDVELVVAAALRLVDAEGLSALTMRRLAQDMGIDAMSLYRYTPTHEALVSAIADVVMGQLQVPNSEVEWSAQLRAIAHDFRRLMLEHPDLVPILVTRPLFTPLAFRPLRTLRYLESFLQLLTDAGFAVDDVLPICRGYFGFLYGHALTELHRSVIDADATDHLAQLGLQHLSTEAFPVLHTVAARLATYDGGADLDRGLDALLDAMARQVPRPVCDSSPSP